MTDEPFLSRHIHTIDRLFCTDMWEMLEETTGLEVDIDEKEQ